MHLIRVVLYIFFLKICEILAQVQNLTICSFESDPYVMDCHTGYTFNIINATLYDFENCSDTRTPLQNIQKLIQKLCYAESSCSIYKTDITRYYQFYNNMENLGAIIFWYCEKASKLINFLTFLFIFYLN